MDIKEIIKVLEDHNKWRRDQNYPSKLKMTDPVELGLAIEGAIDKLNESLVNIEIALKALNNISKPIAYLQDEAKKADCNLNGLVAMELTKNPMFFKDIADEALNCINFKK